MNLEEVTKNRKIAEDGSGSGQRLVRRWQTETDSKATVWQTNTSRDWQRRTRADQDRDADRQREESEKYTHKQTNVQNSITLGSTKFKQTSLR